MKTAYLAVFAVLAACGATQTRGSFLVGQTQEQATMAGDVAALLTKYYPVEQTAFALQHEAQDTFGLALAAQLRRDGYEVALSGSPDKRWKALQYIVDAIRGTQLLRVEVHVGATIYARAYTSTDHGLVPSGSWTAIESGKK